MSLSTKYRPKTLDEVRGNKELKEKIKAHFKSNDWNHSILIHGQSGCGKTTLARIVATEILGVPEKSVCEINASTNNGVDDARAIEERMSTMPILGKYNVFIVDECQNLTPAAKSALLKPCEDGGDYNVVFFCTTNPTKFFKGDKGEEKSALVTRLAKWLVTPIDDAEAKELLLDVLDKEGAMIPRAVLNKIVEVSNGSSRDLIENLAGCIGISEEAALAHLNACGELSASTNEDSPAFKFACSLVNGSSCDSALKALKAIKDSKKEEPVTLAKLVISVASSNLLNRGFSERAASVLQNFSKHYENPTNSEWGTFVLAVVESLS